MLKNEQLRLGRLVDQFTIYQSIWHKFGMDVPNSQWGKAQGEPKPGGT